MFGTPDLVLSAEWRRNKSRQRQFCMTAAAALRLGGANQICQRFQTQTSSFLILIANYDLQGWSIIKGENFANSEGAILSPWKEVCLIRDVDKF